jgi:protein phosphatase
VESERHAYLVLGAETDRGRARARNQDSLFVLNGTFLHEQELLPIGLLIVADGVGEGGSGAQASALAVRVVADWVLMNVYRPMLLDSEPPSFRPAIHQALRTALHEAHEHIRQAHPGAKTTLTCAFILGQNAFVAHVGDSRAYLVHENVLSQVTTDHSLVNRLVDVGQITPQEAMAHPQRNVLYGALGREGELQIDTYLQPMPPGSGLLLCSDGLWGAVSEATISYIVRTAPSPQIACRQLVARANLNGGEDNITAALVQLVG